MNRNFMKKYLYCMLLIAILLVCNYPMAHTTTNRNFLQINDSMDPFLSIYNEGWIVDDEPGDGDFSSIQDAINAASEGDQIFVFSGDYAETLTIIKNNLTLIGFDIEKGEGEDSGKPLVRSDDTDDVLTILGDYCNFSGFTCKGRQNSPIHSKDAHYGIYIGGSYNILSDNEVRDISGDGILLDNCSYNTLYDNRIINVNFDGIRLNNSAHDNIIVGNRISHCGIGEKEEYFEDDLRVSDGSGIDISNRDHALQRACYNNNISYNSIRLVRNEPAISIGIYSHHNHIFSNIIHNNSDHGLHFKEYANNNMIINNSIIGNKRYGIKVDLDAYKNTFYLNVLYNNFLSNADDDNEKYMNNWNSTEKIHYNFDGYTGHNYVGNEWGENHGIDVNHDGLYDDAFEVGTAGAVDEHPIVIQSPCRIIFEKPNQLDTKMYLLDNPIFEFDYHWKIGPLTILFQIICDEEEWEVKEGSICLRLKHHGVDEYGKICEVESNPNGYYEYVWTSKPHGAIYVIAEAEVTNGEYDQHISQVVGVWNELYWIPRTFLKAIKE